MLEDIREKKTNRIAYFLVIIAGIGMLFIGIPFFNHGGEINLATVNGKDIPMRFYNDTYRDIQQQYPDLDETGLKQHAVRTTIERNLLQEQALASRYRLSDTGLYHIIKEQFGDDTQYQQWLKAQGVSAQTYQNSVRQNQSVGRYYGALQTGSETSPLQQHYLESQAQERGYTLYTIPRAPLIAAVSVDDAALEKHYQANSGYYSTPENVDISYTIYDLADLPVSESRLAAARTNNERRSGRYLIFDDAKTAAEAEAAIKAKEKTFADYWQAIGDKNIAGEAGEMGPATKGKGVSPELDEALFALSNQGEVSPLIHSEYGNILIELGTIEQSTRSDDELRRIAAQENEALYNERANLAFDAAQSGKNLAAITDITGGSTQTLSAINANSSRNDAIWLQNPKVQAQLFGTQALTDNKVGEPVEIAPQRTLFFTVTRREKPQPRPLAEVRSEVEADYRKESVGTALQARGEALKKALVEAPEKAAALQQEYQVRIEMLVPSNRHTAQNPLVPQLFEQNERISSIEAANGDLIIARLDSVKAGDVNKLPEPIRQGLGQQWQLQELGGFSTGISNWLYRHAKISINKEALQQH